MACTECGGGGGNATAGEARPLAAADAAPMVVKMLAALPYSVLLPMALIIYNVDRQRRLTVKTETATLPGPIAAWLIERGAATAGATDEGETTDDRRPGTDPVVTLTTTAETPLAADSGGGAGVGPEPPTAAEVALTPTAKRPRRG